MIRLLEMENWRSHQRSALEFSKGTNFLVGIMGSGKSSVLDAISFALYGTFPALKRNKVNLKDVLFYGSESAKVRLAFDFDGNEYSVLRTVSSKGATDECELTQAGKLVEKGPRAVTSRISKILGVDFELFSRAIYSEQNRVDYFLSLDPKKRKGEIDELLGLDRFELARSGITAVQNRLIDQRKGLAENFSEEEYNKALAELGRLQEEFAQAAAQITKTQQELESLSSAQKKARVEYDRLLGMKAEHERLVQSIANYEGEAKALSKIAESADRPALFESHASLKKSIESQNSALAQLKGQIGVLERDISQSNAKIGYLRAQIGRLEHLKSSVQARKAELETARKGEGTIESMIEKASAAHEAALVEVSVLRSKKEEALGAIGAMNAAGANARCPVCSKPLEGGELEHLKSEKEKLTAECDKGIVEGQKKARELQSALQSLQSRLRLATGLEQSISQLESEISKIADPQPAMASESSLLEFKMLQKNELSLKSESISKELAEKSGGLARIQSQLDALDKLSRIESANSELKKRLAALGFSPEAYERSRDSLEGLKVGIARLESALSGLAKTRSSMEQAVAGAKAESDRLARMKNAMSEMDYRVDQASILKNSILATQLAVRNEYVGAVNLALEEIWQIVYPYGDIKKVRLAVDEKDYFFEVFDSQWRGLDTVASGGERACLALSLRIAFATVLTPNLSWLILDEPTHNLDSDAVKTLSAALADKIPSLVEQVFVITHDTALVDYGMGRVYSLHRDKEKNEPSVVTVQ
ncbi:MAG: SMC family ATPase [Candidatus Micrarchaeia archaeon]